MHRQAEGRSSFSGYPFSASSHLAPSSRVYCGVKGTSIQLMRNLCTKFHQNWISCSEVLLEQAYNSTNIKGECVCVGALQFRPLYLELRTFFGVWECAPRSRIF
ncbi:hypothetical protein AVEN_181463-1 [Araneus ventricosus]|uniref:Uncharacterized protein n=1 Tax=Araneus ventricosus TaxID=182803 RepID=A0A4Y2HUW3_ARAVE|nr:hypothetical protein AVEN_181463-1 [Araneus ventricosus]